MGIDDGKERQMAYIAQYMTWVEVKEQLAVCATAIVPIGSTEQHGLHLPLGTDIFLAERLAELVSERTGALVFPSLNFGYSWSWRDRYGTVSLSQEHLQMVLKDVVTSMERYGVKRIVFLNGHEANGAAMKYAIRDIQDETDVKVLGMFYPGIGEIYGKYMESPTWGGMFHACEFETSLMLAAREHLVHMELAREEYPDRPALYGMDNTSIGDLSVTGVYGNPTAATKEKGEAMLREFAEKIAKLLKES